jgi:hypothetical protein
VTRTTGAELARAHPAEDATVGGMEGGDERQQILDRLLLGGRLVHMPAKRSRRLVVLDHLAQSFEPGVRYTEPEVNAALRGFDDDVAALRRYLVDEGFLAREAGVYWRSGGSVDLGSPAGPRPGGP